MKAIPILIVLLATSPADAAGPAPLHPKFKLLDAAGQPVIRSGQPMSPMLTCGACHDADYIAGHSYHASVGTDQHTEPGHAPSGRPWDVGPGLFGRWDPLAYGPHGPSLDVASWLEQLGDRHVGGGPAQAVGAEMDCFVCHLPSPDHTARKAELRAHRFEWAATASLASTGLVRRTSDGWQWNPAAFDREGQPLDSVPRPQLSTSANCGLCHGLVHMSQTPLTIGSEPRPWGLETKGQVFASQRLKDSGLNLAGKAALARPFDVHAEHLLQCASCHNAINNPTVFAGVARDVPSHVLFEPRRLGPGEYLTRPNHDLAKGHTPQGTVARNLDGTMRRCEDCHDARVGHTWLPYPQRHFQALNCESCHVPRVYLPAREQTDWTVLRPDGSPALMYRGVKGDVNKAASLLTGFQPVLLPRQERDGSLKLTPHNIITTWYWVAGNPPEPVSFEDLRRALLSDGAYRPEIQGLLDKSGELHLDTPVKAAVVRTGLEALGLHNPRIRGEIQPYSLHHGVATGEWAVRSCAECHSAQSRVTTPMELARYVPGGVLPTLVGDANVSWDGGLFVDESGRLLYEPGTAGPRLHLVGRDRWRLGDMLGLGLVACVLMAVVVHGGLRIRATRKAR